MAVELNPTVAYKAAVLGLALDWEGQYDEALPHGLRAIELDQNNVYAQAYLSELYFADQFVVINDGYGVDWVRALDAVETLGADIFVPGHGPIPADPRETRQGLRRFRQMLVDVREAVQKEIARGATEDQAVAAIRLPQYETMRGYNTQRETAVRRLYQQLTGKLP